MKFTLLVLVVCFSHCFGAVVVQADKVVNNRPIIGILSQEKSLSITLPSKYSDENYTSYIAASYVKDVEASGARVVPIMIGKPRSYYKDIMSKINGVLFPGGAACFNQSNGYADAGQHIYEIANELNEAGDYFPIFGTCLGFELIIILASGRGKIENRAECDCINIQPLQFTADFRSSNMFKDASDEVVNVLAHEDVTVNYHTYCILDSNMEAYNLTNDFLVTSYGTDDNGLTFIASYEHNRFPYYAVQFHPEKSSFEWNSSQSYPHSSIAVKTNRYFMDFFIDECKKNVHRFASEDEENKYLIYNYEPHFTSRLGSSYNQCYLFEP